MSIRVDSCSAFHPEFRKALSVKIHVKFFALLRDRAGVAELSLDLPASATVSTAADSIAAQYPALRDLLPRIAYAVNREYVPATTILKDNDELALIPPVSGGSI